MILTSKNNPLIKETVLLKEKKGRKELGMFLVEGRKMSLECANSDFEIDCAFLSETYDGEIPKTAARSVRVSEDVLRYLSDEKTPQGIVCRVRIPDTGLIAPTGSCLLLDGVADPGNVGTILRTANAAGYTQAYLTSNCADPFSPKSVRASMSGVFFTKICRGEREEILSVLEGTPVIVADMQGKNLFSYTPPEKFALVIGNEGNGVSQAVRAVATDTVKIPMRKTQESLNAAISAGIMMYFLQKNEFSE